MNAAREVFMKFLADNGLVMTPQRAVIVDCFLNEEGHFTAEHLFNLAKQYDPAIGQATVYRTLKLLMESGLADGFDAGDGVMLYEHAYGHKHHDHLICEGCGQKVEILEPEIEARQIQLAEEHGFILTGHRMLLYGRCSRCKEEE